MSSSSQPVPSQSLQQQQKELLDAQLKSGSYVSPRLTNKTYLLDIPRNILLQILNQIVKRSRNCQRFPLTLLPILESCRELQYLASTFLTDDSFWIKQYPANNEGSIPDCVYLHPSVCCYDENDGSSNTLPKLSQCVENPCFYIHQRMAWYNRAGSNLQILDLSSLFSEIPTRDAYYLMLRFSKGITKLRKLDLGEFCTLSESRTIKLCDGLRRLIPVTLSTLQTIVFNTQFTLLLNLICSFSFPHINNIHLVLDGDDYESCLQGGIKLLSHLKQCDSPVSSLIVDGHGWQFMNLNKLLEHCPLVNDVELRADRFYGDLQFEFPEVEDLTCSNAKKLIIKGAHIDRDHMIRVAEYVKATKNITEFELQYCTTTFVSDALERCGISFGDKLTTINLFDSEAKYSSYRENCYWDRGLVESMDRFCTNLKVLRLALNENDENEIKTLGCLLRKLQHLKEICIHSTGLSNDMTTELADGLRYSPSKIEVIYFNKIFFSMRDVWMIMDYTGCSLRSFRMTFDGYLMGEVGDNQYDYDDVKGVLQILKDVYNHPSLFPHLGEFMIPVGALCNMYCDEEKKLGRKIVRVLTKMLQRFDNFFDIRDAILHVKEMMKPEVDEI